MNITIAPLGTFSSLDELKKKLQSIARDSHDGEGIDHSFEYDPAYPSFCKKCGWVEPHMQVDNDTCHCRMITHVQAAISTLEDKTCDESTLTEKDKMHTFYLVAKHLGLQTDLKGKKLRECQEAVDSAYRHIAARKAASSLMSSLLPALLLRALLNDDDDDD